MTFEQASKIGTAMDGYVKCTYAEIHSPSAGKLFSIKRSECTGIRGEVNEVVADVDGEAAIVFDIPIVHTDMDMPFSPDGKWISCAMNLYAVDIIMAMVGKKQHALEKHYERLAAVYRKRAEIFSRLHVGQKRVESVRNEMLKAEERARRYAQYVADLKNALVNQVVYVKPVAIDWIPANIDNMDVNVLQGAKVIDLKNAVHESEEKLSKAKKLLLAAGVVNII